MHKCSSSKGPVVKGDKLRKTLPKSETAKESMNLFHVSAIRTGLHHTGYCLCSEYIRRFQANPEMKHWKVATNVVRYLQRTMNVVLTFNSKDDLHVIGYTYSNFAGCVDDPKSTLGYIFTLEGTISNKV